MRFSFSLRKAYRLDSLAVGRVKTGLIAGPLMGLAASFVDHFEGVSSNPEQMFDKRAEAWDMNNKFRVLLSEENKAKRDSVRAQEFEVLRQL